MKQKDIDLIKQLAELNQKKVHAIMKKYLKKMYPKITSTKEYIYAEGTIPIAVLAHMDTVSDVKRDTLFLYDKEQDIMTFLCPTFDDRIGIFMIIKLIQSGYRPHVILTTDEEMGCLGASALIKRVPKSPFKNLKYMIQLDRRGEKDCVFYDCENPDFTKYVESFGFKKAIGSFSDISVIAPKWKTAAVNLSVGYFNEHSNEELLYVPAMEGTLQKVKTMLDSADKAENYKYIESEKSKSYSWGKSLYNYDFDEEFCDSCKKTYSIYEMIPVQNEEGYYEYYCPSCMMKHVEWCTNCGRSFKIKEEGETLCPDCKKLLEGENAITR